MSDKRIGITQELVAVAMAQKTADLIIKDATLVNVLTAQLEKNIDVVIHKGFIVFVGNDSSHPIGENTQVIEASGEYLVPGFIDSHMHVESSMVDLRSFVTGTLPHGTTTICPDIHEMTNVLGLRAVELFAETAKDLPVKVLTAMPVCVPSISGMENAGAELSAEDISLAYSKGWAQLQGEQMNFPGVLFGDSSVHDITEKGLEAGVVMTGHYSSPDMSNGLNAFITAGMTACHESTTADEALSKVSRGMYVQMRYGSAWLDLPKLVPAFLSNPKIDTRLFTIVSDDMSAATISEEGHLTRALKKAISMGVEPIEAIQMVTINAAQLLKKDHWIGSISPGRAADILIIDDLERLGISTVISDGKVVVNDGKLTNNIPSFNYPEWATKSMHLAELVSDDFVIHCSDNQPKKVRAIEIFPGEVVSKEQIVTITPQDCTLKADAENDLAKLAMFYRHETPVPEADKKTLGFLKGVTFDPKAAYASTISHDCHNLLIVGTDDSAMTLAGNTLREIGGGIVIVKDQRVIAKLSLPFAGLMSLNSMADTATQLKKVQEGLVQIGCIHESVEMTLSLLGLIVLPELHISNKGLVKLSDGNPPHFVDVIL